MKKWSLKMGPVADMQCYQTGEKPLLHNFDTTGSTHQGAETGIIRKLLN